MIEAGPSFCCRAVTTLPGMSKKSAQRMLRLMSWQGLKRALGQDVGSRQRFAPQGKRTAPFMEREKWLAKPGTVDRLPQPATAGQASAVTAAPASPPPWNMR